MPYAADEAPHAPPEGPGSSKYSEQDDAATELLEALVCEPRWLVQRSSLDRCMLETSELLQALASGALRPEMLVWRGGMQDWLPIAHVPGLGGMLPSAASTLPPRRRNTPPAARARVPVAGLVAALAIALSTAAVTLGVLAAGGVFESGPQPAGASNP